MSTDTFTYDPSAFFEHMRRVVDSFTPARARQLACAIAQRHVESLGEDAGSIRAIVAEARALVTTQPVPNAQLDTWLESLQSVSQDIDPDRFGATDKFRAISVIKLALRACTDTPPVATFEVICAALAVRALRWPASNEAERQAERNELQKKWEWEAVQIEMRWLEREASRQASWRKRG